MNPSGGEPLIRLRGLTKTYGRGDAAFQALRGVDLDIAKGEFVAVMRSEERRVGKECRSRWSPYH